MLSKARFGDGDRMKHPLQGDKLYECHQLSEIQSSGKYAKALSIAQYLLRNLNSCIHWSGRKLQHMRGAKGVAQTEDMNRSSATSDCPSLAKGDPNR